MTTESQFYRYKKFITPTDALKVMASDIGLSESHLYRVLNNISPMSQKTAELISTYTQNRITIEELLSDQNSRHEIARFLFNEVYMPRKTSPPAPHAADPSLQELI